MSPSNMNDSLKRLANLLDGLLSTNITEGGPNPARALRSLQSEVCA